MPLCCSAAIRSVQKPGGLANLDQMAVRIAEIGADLASVIFWLGEKRGAFGRPLLVGPCDVRHAHVEEPASPSRVGRRTEADARLVAGGAAAAHRGQPRVPG